MPNVAAVLKEEIARIAKKQAKSLAMPVKKDVVALKHVAAALRRQVAALQRDVKKIASEVRKRLPAPAVAPVEGKRMWVFSKGIVALRRKLNLSQQQLAKLIGVSPQSVTLWENKGGKLDLRAATRARIAAIRGIGAREARRRLADLGVGPRTRGRKPRFDKVAAPAPKAPAARKARKA